VILDLVLTIWSSRGPNSAMSAAACSSGERRRAGSFWLGRARAEVRSCLLIFLLDIVVGEVIPGFESEKW